MAADEKWYFTKEQLANTPSRKCGIDADKELSYRQQAANFIQDMGQRLSVTQLCINTAIVYMHRFYVFHSLSQFHRNAIATAALFLAAKVEEQPRKLEHVIKVAHVCLHKDQPPPDVRSEQYLEQAQDVVFNENVLLQTLGFDVAIDHPHTHVVRCCHLVRASKDLAQASYFMASNSLHMTTMCLQYKPTVVACFCIHLACKWSNWEIPQSNEGKHWFWYVDRSVTSEMLQQLTAEFLHIFDNCPSRLKRRIKSISAKQSPSLNHPSLPNSPFDMEPRQVSPAADGGPTFQSSRPFPLEESKKPSGQSSSSSTTTSATASSSSRPPVDYREYREKKERERLEREKAAAGGSTGASNSVQTSEGQGLPKQSTSSHHSSSHHAKQQQQGSTGTSTSKQHPGVPGSKPVSHHNHHHGAHRGDSKPSGQQPAGSQRHSVASASGQSGRPSRGGPRDYNASVTSNAAGYQQTHQTKDATSQGTSEATTGTELNPSGFEEPPLHVSEKPSNNRSVESKHEKSQRSGGSGGGYDPRHKALDAKEAEQKGGAYAKYQQDQKGRKIIDSVEQRSEEVRKLIEKPLPLPKATARLDATSQKDDYVAYMMKQQAHNAKYGQPQQQQTSSEKPGPLLATPSLATRNPPDYVAGSTRDKTAMAKNSSQQTHVQANASTVKKFDNKSNVKNGNSQLISGEQQETTKHEKRSRHQPEDERLQGNAIGQQQASNVQHNPGQPVKQHKSLFSPEKTTNQRESHTRISSRSSRQKTPPSTGSVTSATTTTTTKSSKAHDRVPDQSGNLDHFTSLDSSQSNNQNVMQHQQQQQQQQQHHHHHHHHHHQQQQHHSQTQNTQESSSIKATTSHTKRHRTSSIADTTKQQQTIKAEHQIKTETGQMKIEKLDTSTRITEQPIKIEPLIKHEPDDNRETYESMKMLGRVPELLQPIRENLNSSNGRGSNSNTMITAPCSLANDLKLPELIKPFEPELPVRQIALTNGLESKALHPAKQHEDAFRDSQDSGIFSRSSQDYLSPRKSAQSISALLQEPLAPMPSLLQSIDEYDAQRNPASQPPSQPSQEGQNSSQRSSSSSYQYNEAREAPGRETRREVGNAEVSAISTQDKDVVISTVDITALAAPPQTVPEATNTRVLNPAQAPSNNPQASLDDSFPTTTSTTTTTAATIPGTATSSSANASAAAATSVNARKSGHHKSDKKKKKDKHKHKEKDKEKSRDKKKPKHKDKEKEKHIKITIPKDKLNLTGETAAIQTIANPSQSEEKKSPQAAATGLKIKIPKERLKANNEASSQSLVQAPLKITIRTSVNENSESTVSMSSTSSRKRDRSNMEPPNEPPTKKQYPHHHSQGTSTTSIVPTTTTTTTTTNSGTSNQQQHYHHQASQQGLTSFVQQPGQRPNGRHYTSNNKDKHTSSSSSHHKSTNKLTQQQQQQLLLQHQQQQQLQLQLQMQLQQQHHQHSHPT